jgi:predicted peptidase
LPDEILDRPGFGARGHGVVQKVLREYAVDRRRILVTGFSLGGRDMWFLASRRADLCTAAE